ncbi:MAG: hypothetical protein LBR38_01990 [Synergistaceae bacterium]|jgi:primosomal protein N' (replication factor Y)|nr:hypothetical protein [Synergistaceae bacterium]
MDQGAWPSTVDVVVPGPWWNALTYAIGAKNPEPGARVRVPVGRARRIGFVAGPGHGEQWAQKDGLKVVSDVLDERCVLGADLWALSLWIGGTFLCGAGEALQMICPEQVLSGEPVAAPPVGGKTGGVFNNEFVFDLTDDERLSRYEEESNKAKRALVIFPEAKAAEAFFSRLAGANKDAMLWPNSGGKKKRWEAWLRAASGDARVIVGTGSAVFAPCPAGLDLIIVEDEANPSYVFVKHPQISARSAAGRRAMLLGAKLVLGGWMPSSRTYIRMRPQTRAKSKLPQSAAFVAVDMKEAAGAVPGIEKPPPVTPALITRTGDALREGRSAVWILDRKGHAGDVFCSECGFSFTCRRCGAAMRVEGDPPSLRCLRCGFVMPLFTHCPNCRGELLRGVRPGLEALLPIAKRCSSHAVLMEKSARGHEHPTLVLGTRGALSICDTADVGLVAWLDIDFEGMKVDHCASFRAFSMVLESGRRGLRSGDGNNRVVLVQSRRPQAWANSFPPDWDRFWRAEIAERDSLGLPPRTLLASIEAPPGVAQEIAESIERAGLGVSIQGTREGKEGAGAQPGESLWVSIGEGVKNRLAAALAPYFRIERSSLGFPTVTVWTE